MAILRDVPQEVMFRVLIERINIVTFLPWLRAAAVPRENQLDFVMAGNDRKQWQVVASSLSLLKMSVVVQEQGSLRAATGGEMLATIGASRIQDLLGVS